MSVVCCGVPVASRCACCLTLWQWLIYIERRDVGPRFGGAKYIQREMGSSRLRCPRGRGSETWAAERGSRVLRCLGRTEVPGATGDGVPAAESRVESTEPFELTAGAGTSGGGK
jgi:hypothetical protein